MGKSINITGKKFGNLLAVEYSHTNKIEYWKFECELCNEIGIRRKPDVMRGKTTSCGCQKNVGLKNGQWLGYNEIDGRIFGHYKKNAKKRGIEFDITIKDMYDQFLVQNKKCPYTNYDLILSASSMCRRTPKNASLDRIDSNKGYLKGNIQWVYKKINILKNDLSHHEFIDLCHTVSKNCPFTPKSIKGNSTLIEK
jgi:hypothetical protein